MSCVVSTVCANECWVMWPSRLVEQSVVVLSAQEAQGWSSFIEPIQWGHLTLVSFFLLFFKDQIKASVVLNEHKALTPHWAAALSLKPFNVMFLLPPIYPTRLCAPSGELVSEYRTITIVILPPQRTPPGSTAESRVTPLCNSTHAAAELGRSKHIPVMPKQALLTAAHFSCALKFNSVPTTPPPPHKNKKQSLFC